MGWTHQDFGALLVVLERSVVKRGGLKVSTLVHVNLLTLHENLATSQFQTPR